MANPKQSLTRAIATDPHLWFAHRGPVIGIGVLVLVK